MASSSSLQECSSRARPADQRPVSCSRIAETHMATAAGAWRARQRPPSTVIWRERSPAVLGPAVHLLRAAALIRARHVCKYCLLPSQRYLATTSHYAALVWLQTDEGVCLRGLRACVTPCVLYVPLLPASHTTSTACVDAASACEVDSARLPASTRRPPQRMSSLCSHARVIGSRPTGWRPPRHTAHSCPGLTHLLSNWHWAASTHPSLPARTRQQAMRLHAGTGRSSSRLLRAPSSGNVALVRRPAVALRATGHGECAILCRRALG
jgi:hypothetical protein